MGKKPAGGTPGDGISRGCNRPRQVRKQREHSWTPERREAFLEMLAQTCNVRRSLSETGMSEAGLYYLRRRDAAFAREWDAALEHGYALLEAEMIERARNGQIREVMSPRGKVVRLRSVDNKLGTTLLALHAQRVAAIRAAREMTPDVADEETLRAKVAEAFDRMGEHRAWMGRAATGDWNAKSPPA